MLKRLREKLKRRIREVLRRKRIPTTIKHSEDFYKQSTKQTIESKKK